MTFVRAQPSASISNLLFPVCQRTFSSPPLKSNLTSCLSSLKPDQGVVDVVVEFVYNAIRISFSELHRMKATNSQSSWYFLCLIFKTPTIEVFFTSSAVHINESVAQAAELSGHLGCFSDRGEFYSSAFFHQLRELYCNHCIWVFAADAIYTMYCYAGLLLS